MKHIQPIILAAGRGTRMGGDLPKALTPFHGEPLLTHVLRATKAGLPESAPVIVVGYHADEVTRALGNEYTFATQTEQRGTGHAVSCALPLLHPDTSRVIVLYTDHPLLSPHTVHTLSMGHENGDAVLTMGTVTVPDFSDWHSCFEKFGRIIRNKTGAITGIREWKDATEAERSVKEVNPSFFCFDRSWLEQVLTTLTDTNAAHEYYLTDVIAAAVNAGKHIATIAIDPSEALGVNTPQELAIAEHIHTQSRATSHTPPPEINLSFAAK